jgi:hypothetical protein
MLSSSAAMGMGGYHQHQQQPQQRGAGPVFTAAQWAELEQQALIYKYLMAGVPVPSELLLPIRPHSAAANFNFANPAASPFYHHHHHPSSKLPSTLSLYLFICCRESRRYGCSRPCWALKKEFSFLGHGIYMLNGIDLLLRW